MPVTEVGGRDKVMIVTMNYLSEALRVTGPREVTISYNSVINATGEKSTQEKYTAPN